MGTDCHLFLLTKGSGGWVLLDCMYSSNMEQQQSWCPCLRTFILFVFCCLPHRHLSFSFKLENCLSCPNTITYDFLVSLLVAKYIVLIEYNFECRVQFIRNVTASLFRSVGVSLEAVNLSNCKFPKYFKVCFQVFSNE